MRFQTVTESRLHHLLDRVRTKQALPTPSERRSIREAAGCSLREVGDAVGVSFTAVKRWEQGATPRSDEHLALYSQLLDQLRAMPNETIANDVHDVATGAGAGL